MAALVQRVGFIKGSGVESFRVERLRAYRT